MTSRDIRNTFLRYFADHGHTTVPSSSLVPAADPTLLFTTAGMVQFKKCFLGEEVRPYTRAASCQKCVRAGGKHNDLENVGYTARHHTFFEMLGNFSFGDYFKEGAIEMAWELLTRDYGLPPERLWATVFYDDDEARRLWEKIAGLPQDRIVGLGEKDNFWAMGDTGPCGPCSEIVMDQGEHLACGPNCAIGVCDCDRYLEIWNLVFMQFNRTADGRYEPLPKPSIDTGMGLERLTAVIQGVTSNFDTDLIRPIIARLEDLSGLPYGPHKAHNIAFRVIADHARALTFMIADGVLPGNEGRSYVLRRIIRRALRFGRLLNLKSPFLPTVSHQVVELFADIYPELTQARPVLEQVVAHEEERFADTLDYGLKLLHDEVATLQAKGKDTLPGEVAFRLYDTYGFPLDLVQDALKEAGLKLDLPGFEAHMQRQRQASRAAWRGGPGEEVPAVYQELAAWPPTEFLGYHTLSATSTVTALITHLSLVPEAQAGQEVEVVTAASPFYGEAGGQVGDTGVITGPDWHINVTNTQRLPNDLIVHQGTVTRGVVRLNDPCTLEVNAPRRRAIARHHTATHLLQAALQRHLGPHVKQSGSLVAPDRLRFDFTHYQPVTHQDLATLEEIVNDAVVADLPVETSLVPISEALASGAMALFEEKYGDTVRLVAIPGVSKELCGGTHVHHTGQLGLVKILKEESIAAGIRRLEAACGLEALKYLQAEEQQLHQAAALLKAPPEELLPRLKKLLQRTRDLEKEVAALTSRLIAAQAAELVDRAVHINGINVLAQEVQAPDPKGLRDFAVNVAHRLKSGVIVLGSKAGDKALLIALITPDLTGRFHAGNLIRQLAPMVGGSGGGKADLAQAGGSNPHNLHAALAQALELVAQQARS